MRAVPAKRSRASRDKNINVEALVPSDEDSLRVFGSGSGQRSLDHPVHVNSLESYTDSLAEPLKVLGSSALSSAAEASRARGGSSVIPSPALAWEVCLVQSPPGADKSGGEQAGGATAAAGSTVGESYTDSGIQRALTASGFEHPERVFVGRDKCFHVNVLVTAGPAGTARTKGVVDSTEYSLSP